ncbi:protein NEN1-like [Solanum dulcamara]|uniref:protein NEN1-like n=1 Tax=Solanum dulcamara TaxID=45834 RepID=UPI0024866050|nr:protein NEN1-like [Solanum dulcamara]
MYNNCESLIQFSSTQLDSTTLMEMIIDGEYDPIVFFDVERRFSKPGQDWVLVEFGSISVCPRRLIELDSYSTLIRPDDPSFLDNFSDLKNGITREALASAPHFSQVADKIYQILHGKIWAGHKIQEFDCIIIIEAFDRIDRPAPEHRHLIDSLPLLTKWFGKRAGDMKLKSLAAYFGFEEQVHRSLDDVRLNLEVVKHCGTVLFLESIFRNVFPQASWISPHEIDIHSTYAILASFYDGNPKIRVMHKTNDLKLHCNRLNVRFGIRKFDDANPRLTFVVDTLFCLYEVLDKCDVHVKKRYTECGGGSEWLPVVNRDYQSIRLHLKARVLDGDIVQWETQIERYQSGNFTNQRVEYSNFDSEELERLFIPGSYVDAFFSFDTFDNTKKAGINLVVDKLIIHR